MTFHTKAKVMLIFTNLIGFGGAIMFFSWWGLALATGIWICMNLGVSAGYHRLFSHKSYKTNKFWENFLLIFGTLGSIGSSISWVGQHRVHHANSDVEGRDPYYAHNGIIESWIKAPWALDIPLLSIKDLLRDKRHRFLHTYYFHIITAWAIALLLINPELLIWAWALPSAVVFHALQLTGILGHTVGWQDYDTGDLSKNNHIFNFFTFGESYQNTHHHDGKRLIMGTFDLSGYFCKAISIKEKTT